MNFADLVSKTNRVYMKTGSLKQSPDRRRDIKATVLSAAQGVADGLTELCGTEIVDLAVMYAFLVSLLCVSHPLLQVLCWKNHTSIPHRSSCSS
jgi:hypothetical protein